MISKSVSWGIVGIGAALLLAACAPKIQWSPTQPSPRPMLKRHVTTVEVFQDQAPPRPNQEVGVITAQKSRSTKTDVRAKLTDDIRKKAATLGCDAIHVRDVSQPEIPGSKKQPPMTIEGGCLMWTEDAPATAEPVPITEPAAPVIGCANDMHCKGDRICENGQCVSPPSPSGAAPSEGVSSDKACAMDTDCPGDEICRDSKCKLP